MGDEIIQKKKILLLSDDMRMSTGIATMSRELIIGTLHQYEWAQLAYQPNSPDVGKVINMKGYVEREYGIKDAYLNLYPFKTYGNEAFLFSVISAENPDVILHFTDPRYWKWLYDISHQIRNKIPLTYLNIWDDLPYPMWNKPFYDSCDALFSISKQTYNINKWVLGPENCITVDGCFNKNGEFIKNDKE